MDRAKSIFGNEISASDYQKACKKKNGFLKKYKNDSDKLYPCKPVPTAVITELFRCENLVPSAQAQPLAENAVVVGNIRMGFGHYRISMAIASAAASMGYTPYWFDLLSFPESTCSKIVEEQNKLYSFGSRLSQKFSLFNKLVWEPMNSEGFRKLSYNSADQKVAELMAPVCKSLPQDVPFVSTHAWCAQAALHAGLTNVVSAVCDNWPMALHLAEGSVHAVQTKSAYLGYKVLRGMDKKRALSPMPSGEIVYTGHYIDHELVANLEQDCTRRLQRLTSKAPKLYLLTIGGAGAQLDLFCGILTHLLPQIKAGKAALCINFGDHREAYDMLCTRSKDFKALVQTHFDVFPETKAFAAHCVDANSSGIHAFCHQNIFEAVYATNLLMRVCDVMITKPSELAFYPVPKLMIKRVGGHEAYGAIHASECGDGTYECETVQEICGMLDAMEGDDDILTLMNNSILENKKAGLYDGAYRVVELAVNKKRRPANVAKF